MEKVTNPVLEMLKKFPVKKVAKIAAFGLITGVAALAIRGAVEEMASEVELDTTESGSET